MKRLMDVTLSLIALILFAPILLGLALLVRVKLGSPVLFCQMRPGKNGKPFRMLKFRTMTEATDPVTGELLADAVRLTTFGKWLRSTSLDELPELWNVFKGDMSLVGPRPLLMEYMPLYDARQRRRHEVRPGVTGWAQINGRNALSWPEKFELDVWYVENHSLWLDIKILGITLKKVWAREAINAVGEATVSRFSGNHSRVGKQ